MGESQAMLERSESLYKLRLAEIAKFYFITCHWLSDRDNLNGSIAWFFKIFFSGCKWLAKKNNDLQSVKLVLIPILTFFYAKKQT